MRIILILEPTRVDVYNYLPQEAGIEYCLLWYNCRADMNIDAEGLLLKFKDIYFWNEYNSPWELIRNMRPDKIVFTEIIDLRFIALIIAAKAKKVSTFYLEHGAAGSAETAIKRWEEFSVDSKFRYLLDRALKSFWRVVKAKLFYYSVLKGFKSLNSYLKFLALPFKMLTALPNKVLSHCIFPERVPDHCIVFNRINYEEFALYTGIQESQALLTGVPFYDKFFSNNLLEGESIVYIDHPYYEENILGWNDAHHSKIAHAIFEFAERNKLKIYVKLHPRSNKQLWESYSYNAEFVTILQEDDCTQIYLESKIIFGYSSSLLTGFLCAHKNVVLLGWHPNPQIFGMDFSSTGLCHSSFTVDDLDDKFIFWCENNLSYQSDKYRDFLHQCNEPFDGQAKQRVIEAIYLL